MRTQRTIGVAACAAGMLALSGCAFTYDDGHHRRHTHVAVAVPEHRRSTTVVTHEVYGPPGTRITEVREVHYVDVPPRAVIVETVPPPPSAIHVWVPGYWHPRGGRYVWMKGAYVVPPRRGAAWVRGHHVRTRHGWHRVGGHWR